MTNIFKFFAIFIISFVLSPSLAYGSDLQGLVNSAEKYYKNGKYADAIEVYNKCISEYGTSASILANLGNAYVKSGDYGRACICYERSLRLKPSDKTVKNNLAYIKSKVEEGNKANLNGKKLSVVPEERGVFSRFLNSLIHIFSSNTWSVLAAISFIILCCFIGIYYFRKEVLIKKIGFFGSFVMIFLCIIFNVFSIYSIKADSKNDEGVVVDFKTSLVSEPLNSAKQVGIPLVRGTKMKVLDRICNDKGKAEWYKVRLNDDIAGWIKSQDFEII